MSKSAVAIVKGTDVSAMIAESLSLLGGVSSLIKPGSTVVIKPNAGHPFPPETSVNTSPAFVAAAIKELRKAKPKEIILAESAAMGCDTLECLEISGIGKAAEEAGIDKIIDIKREKDLIMMPIRDARSAITRVAIPRFMIEADHIVNLPIFKSHVAMVFTCALKNIKGVVQDKVHVLMHHTNLAAAMMDVWSIIRADLSIVDMIRPAEGFGPHHTSPIDFGCVVAGKDPVAVDATICRMIGLDTGKVTYFEPAWERGLGQYLESEIEIRGKSIKEVYKKLWLPYVEGLERWPEYNIYADGSCSSCQGLLAFTMEKLRALDEYDKNAGISICLGPKKSLPEGVGPKDLILFGDCCSKWRDQGIFVKGCPPNESSPLWCILNRTDSDKRDLSQRSREKMDEETRAFLEYSKRLRAKLDQES